MLNKSNIEVSVILTDSKKLIIWVNEEFTRMTGYTLNEVRGRKPSLLQGKNSEESAVLRIRESLNKKVSFHDRITNYRKNGEEYTCALTIQPIFDVEGNLLNFIAFEVDNNFVDPIHVPLMKSSIIEKQKYLTDSEELTIYFKLIDLFRKEKLYLDADLSLQKVSELLGVNVKYISQVVNNQTGRNFKYFVNQYRVQEFEYLVSSGKMDNYTLFSIGQNCGFKNKSTFYNTIINHTGETPKFIANRYL